MTFSNTNSEPIVKAKATLTRNKSGNITISQTLNKPAPVQFPLNPVSKSAQPLSTKTCNLNPIKKYSICIKSTDDSSIDALLLKVTIAITNATDPLTVIHLDGSKGSVNLVVASSEDLVSAFRVLDSLSDITTHTPPLLDPIFIIYSIQGWITKPIIEKAFNFSLISHTLPSLRDLRPLVFS